ncbi:hypothetical protein F444_18625 [Phytophthora nicotianae P1976]|uniref:Uncharacterized protein n=1 Tax=Phytophthora nicotianae P1976 TaxID=1317066 RepID=A0A080ZAS5_PHYNI|nr:hypothetical protein F444_18625 [Phytophthora nicotianae P1976]
MEEPERTSRWGDDADASNDNLSQHQQMKPSSPTQCDNSPAPQPPPIRTGFRSTMEANIDEDGEQKEHMAEDSADDYPPTLPYSASRDLDELSSQTPQMEDAKPFEMDESSDDEDALPGTSVLSNLRQRVLADQATDACAARGKVMLRLLAHTHFPWLDDYHPWMTGHAKPDTKTPLFDCSSLRNVPVPREMDRDQYLIDVFFQMRFYRAHKTGRYNPAKRSSPDSLAEAWQSFAAKIGRKPKQWLRKLRKREADFLEYNIEGSKIEIHLQSMSEGVRCCLRREQICPMCYEDAARASGRTRKGKNGRLSSELLSMVQRFELRWKDLTKARKDEELLERIAGESESSPYTQVDQVWIKQRMRNTDSEVFKIYTMNLKLVNDLKAVKKREDTLHNTVAELKDDLKDLEKVLYEAGISRRRRVE